MTEGMPVGGIMMLIGGVLFFGAYRYYQKGRTIREEAVMIYNQTLKEKEEKEEEEGEEEEEEGEEEEEEE